VAAGRRNRPSDAARAWDWRLAALAAVLLAAIAAIGAMALRKGPAPPDDRTARLSEEVIDKARPLVDAAQYKAAIDLMEGYVRLSGDDVEVRPLLAEAQFKAGRFDDARATVEALLARAPGNARGLWVKGLLARHDGEDPQPYFKRAADSGDATGDILAAWGLELLTAGNIADARKYLLGARDAGINDARTLAPLGQIALGEGRYTEAESMLAEALNYSRGSARIWAMLAEARIRAGRESEALVTLSEAAVSFPHEGALSMRAAEVACDLGRYDQAETFLDAASRNGADELDVRKLRARIVAERPPATTAPAGE
jgi:tetratricopeptide (TPR) repeat protein